MNALLSEKIYDALQNIIYNPAWKLT